MVVVSEFGRTFRENGNRGTDHGHGIGLLGVGRQQSTADASPASSVAIERATLFQDRDYPVLNDYRAVLGGLFRTLWGLPPAKLERVFQQ